MKIAIVSPSYFPSEAGGAEVSVKLLAEGLQLKKHRVTVLAFDGDKHTEDIIEGVRVVRYRLIKGLTDRAQPLTLLPLVTRTMMHWQIEHDLFHIYNVFPLPGAGLYKLMGGKKPVIATFNSYNGFCPLSHGMCPNNGCHFVQRTRCLLEARGISEKALSIPYSAVYPLLTRLTKRADRYIALSKDSKRIYIEHGYDESKIDVIPNFIEQYHFTDSPSLEKHHDFNILYVGTLSESKGVSILLQAFSKVLKNHQNLHLTFVGDGPYKEQLRKLSSALGTDKNVLFTGRILHEDIWRYYQNANVFVHPGIWAEPFGRTILEAMQFHLPLIVSDVGAPPETAADAGLVFKAGDADDLAQKIMTIYSDEKLRLQLSSNCSRLMEKYNIDNVIDQIINVYNKIVTS